MKHILIFIHKILIWKHRKNVIVYWKRFMIPILDYYQKTWEERIND